MPWTDEARHPDNGVEARPVQALAACFDLDFGEVGLGRVGQTLHDIHRGRQRCSIGEGQLKGASAGIIGGDGDGFLHRVEVPSMPRFQSRSGGGIVALNDGV